MGLDWAGGRCLAGGVYRYYRYYNLDLITTKEQMLTRHVLLLETTGRPARPSLLFDLLRTLVSYSNIPAQPSTARLVYNCFNVLSWSPGWPGWPGWPPLNGLTKYFQTDGRPT